MNHFETITVKISPSDMPLLKAVAATDGRRLEDLLQLVMAEGLTFFFFQQHISFRKPPECFTSKEHEQISKNKELQKLPNWSSLNATERKDLGWQPVEEFISLEDLAERIASFATA